MKRFLSILLALCLLAALAAGAFAEETPEAAAAAKREFQALQELGLLNEELVFEPSEENVQPGEEGGSTWVSAADESCEILLELSEDGSQIRSLSITVLAQEGDEPLEDPEPFVVGDREYPYYDIFDRIFAPDVTIGKCAEALAAYYGCEETPEAAYVGTMDQPIEDEADGELPLKDVAFFLDRVVVLELAEDTPLYFECWLMPQRCQFRFGPDHVKG